MPNAIQIVNRYFPDVLHVRDAKRRARIEVTNRDTASALRRTHKTCAMAVACKRKMDLDGVIISVHTAYLVKGTEAVRYQLPQRIAREIISFDRGAKFYAGDYSLNVPQTPLGPRGAKRGGGHQGGAGSGLRRPKHLTKGIRSVLGSKHDSE